MSTRTPVPDLPRQSGLLPAALLGLLGLPLIVEAGPSSDLPPAAYLAGLVLALVLGLMTTMRTRRIERLTALVATVLLGCLCLTQLTVFRPAVVPTAGVSAARDAHLPKNDASTTQTDKKNVTTTIRKNDEE